MRRILFVELLGGFGDLLLALPAIHALARAHPRARVTVLTFAPGRELLAADPHVAEVVSAERGSPEAVAATVAAVAARGFDLIVSDTRYGEIPAVLAATGARVVDDLWRDPPTDQRIDLRFLALLDADGLIDPRDRDLEPEVFLTTSERAEGRRLVGEGPVALLLPEAGMAIKEWAPGRFRALGARLAGAGYRVLAAARGPGLAEAVTAEVLPPLDLRRLAAAAAACAVAVGGDTGPVRLAAAVGTPAVALFGPTWAGRFGLRERHASLQSPQPCHVRDPADMTRQECWYSGRCVFEQRTCTDALTVERVARAVLDVVDVRGRVSA